MTDKIKIPLQVKRDAVKQLRELIVMIENDEVEGVVFCATQPRSQRSLMGVMLNGVTPLMLGTVNMLRSGIEHGLMEHMHQPQEDPAAHLRVVAGTNNVTPIKRATKKRVQKKTPRKK